MADYKDYYKILGVPKTATDAEIKKAFKTAARKYHPDLHPDAQKPQMTEKFKDVNEAYEVLSDKQKRTVYDQVGSAGYQDYARGGGPSAGRRQHSGYAGTNPYTANPFGGMGGGGQTGGFNFHHTGGYEQGDFSDFFQSIFGGMGGANPFGGMGGGRQQARRGAHPQDSEANLTLDLQEAYKGGLVSLTLPNGRATQVKLPAKMADGARIKLKGQANRGADLYITIKIAPNPYFRLQGNDIYATANITPWEAALGGHAAVDMPDGGKLTIKIPPGANSGAKLKLSGKGLGKDGNMYVQLMINNPKTLTKAQKDLYAKLAEIG